MTQWLLFGLRTGFVQEYLVMDSMVDIEELFLMLSLHEETSFQPPSVVCISVIINHTHNNLQILSRPLCANYNLY